MRWRRRRLRKQRKVRRFYDILAGALFDLNHRAFHDLLFPLCTIAKPRKQAKR